MSWRMTVAIVPRGDGERMAEAAVRGGAGGGTLILGKGTAGSSLLQFLGLGESSREMLLAITGADIAPRVAEALSEAARGRRGYGISFGVDVSRLSRGGHAAADSENASPAAAGQGGRTGNAMEYMLVAAIVNAGYADDAMAAARVAGATGGTVLNARGTAREDDAEFFGVKLVPEKELLLVVVERTVADKVFEAIRALPCLAEKGSGIVFEIPASSFASLGAER